VKSDAAIPLLAPESAHPVVVPLADVGNPTECHREPEADQAFIEPLGAGTKAETSLTIDREIDVDGQMLVRAEIVRRRSKNRSGVVSPDGDD
jgi:hypothetical protein